MATKDPREPFTRIDVNEAGDMMKDGAEVVDVREPHEYTAGHVPGAKLIPVNSVYARREELPRDKNRNGSRCRPHSALQPRGRDRRLDQVRHAG